MPGTDDEDKFTPIGTPTPLEQLAEYVEDGGVTITRGDVEKAIALADAELKKYLLSSQRMPKT